MWGMAAGFSDKSLSDGPGWPAVERGASAPEGPGDRFSFFFFLATTKPDDNLLLYQQNSLVGVWPGRTEPNKKQKRVSKATALLLVGVSSLLPFPFLFLIIFSSLIFSFVPYTFWMK